jgi:ParB-like chromosome segregation protein Spo0J
VDSRIDLPQNPTRPEVVMLPVDELVLVDSPRLAGEDVRHTRVLAEVGTGLPPIVVHAGTMRVVDGVHRVQAARLRGETEIAAVLFAGDENAAFVKAVRANVSHGLPLSISDRRVAAARIIAAYPRWSDRAVAAAAGLSPKTARAIRDRLSGTAGQPGSRVGRDGKSRPLNPAESRRRAAALIAQRPGASLREIASSAGISPATARDVRQRLRNGESPLPPAVRQLAGDDRPGAVPASDAVPASGAVSASVPVQSAGSGSEPASRAARSVRELHKAAASETATPSSLLRRLRSDPSLRYSERGRSLLRWLDSHVVEPTDWSRAVEGVPPHCAYTIAELAMRCAKAWERLAEELWARVEDGSSNLAA